MLLIYWSEHIGMSRPRTTTEETFYGLSWGHHSPALAVSSGTTRSRLPDVCIAETSVAIRGLHGP